MAIPKGLFPALLCFLVVFVPAAMFADQWAEPPAPGEELTVPDGRGWEQRRLRYDTGAERGEGPDLPNVCGAEYPLPGQENYFTPP